ncbi:MAG: amidohydrolase family protein [Acidimicrobiia bacterium]|nr:amidohydrolase family protein [Acidimicrobiia bacterium]
MQGWTEWDHGVFPTASDLDSLGIDRPIAVAHYSLHQCVVSSAALDALGIGRTTPDPQGGEIGRGEDGTPSGFLLERAWSSAHARSMAAYTDPDRWAEHIAARSRVLHAEGITAVHDAACSPAAEDLYRSMASARTLPVSVLTMPHPEAILVNDQTSRLEGARTGEGDEWARVGPMKFFADGGQAMAIDARIGGERMTMGLVMDDMAAHVERAVARGWRVAVHAEGNVAIDRSIDAFTAASRRRPDDDHRFRIEHAFVASSRQIAQMRSVGSVAVVQPCFVEHIGDLVAGTSFDDHSWLAFGEMAASGVPLAASSDDPCAPFPPLWGGQGRDPHHRRRQRPRGGGGAAVRGVDPRVHDRRGIRRRSGGGARQPHPRKARRHGGPRRSTRPARAASGGGDLGSRGACVLARLGVIADGGDPLAG